MVAYSLFLWVRYWPDFRLILVCQWLITYPLEINCYSGCVRLDWLFVSQNEHCPNNSLPEEAPMARSRTHGQPRHRILVQSWWLAHYSKFLVLVAQRRGKTSQTTGEGRNARTLTPSQPANILWVNVGPMSRSPSGNGGTPTLAKGFWNLVQCLSNKIDPT